ncbi:hypothetical protein F5Y11DRAFT_363190 [Daldinia sp. FL1419]|nr:hypothetical protein F5Y11DRAFT_363190 [Daldinia sp. FL1419]
MLLAHEDHIRSMRTNPGYFRMILNQRFEHWDVHMPSAGNRSHPLIADQNSYWGRTVRQVFYDAFMIYNILESFYALFLTLHIKLDQELEGLPQTTMLQPDAYQLLYGLYYGVDRVRKEFISRSHLIQSIYASPPIRKYLFCTFPNPEDYDVALIQQQRDVDKPEFWSETIYLLRSLADVENEACPTSKRDILTELELLVHYHPTAKSFISDYVSTQISVLGVFSECIHMLENCQPWILGYEKYRERNIHKLKEFYSNKFGHIFDVRSIPHSLWGRIGDIVQRRLIDESKYPIREPRTVEVIGQIRDTETYFDEFWLQMIGVFEKAGVLKPYMHNILPRVWCKNGEMETASESGGSPGPKLPVDSRTFKVLTTILFDGSDLSGLEDIFWDDLVHTLLAMNLSAEKLFGSAWVFRSMNKDRELTDIVFHEPYMGGKLEFPMMRVYGLRMSSVLELESDMFREA